MLTEFNGMHHRKKRYRERVNRCLWENMLERIVYYHKDINFMNYLLLNEHWVTNYRRIWWNAILSNMPVVLHM